MTCRDEILHCARELVQRSGRNEFSIQEVVDCMESEGTQYKQSTIRTHITSRLCINSPNHHGVIYNDLERIGTGIYRLRG